MTIYWILITLACGLALLVIAALILSSQISQEENESATPAEEEDL